MYQQQHREEHVYRQQTVGGGVTVNPITTHATTTGYVEAGTTLSVLAPGTVNEIIVNAKNEKKELAGLNVRLESFIAQVRELERNNQVLINELTTLKTSVYADIEKSRSAPFDSVSTARTALYQAEIEQVTANLNNQKLRDNIAEYRTRHAEIERFLQTEKNHWGGLIHQATAELEHVKRSYDGVLNEEAGLIKEQERLLVELAAARDELYLAKGEFEKVKLNESRLHAELQFIRSINETEVVEIRRLLSQAPADTREFFESSLANAIREIKVQYDTLFQQSTVQLKSRYEHSISSLRGPEAVGYDAEEIKRLEVVIRESESRYASLESENRVLEEKLRSLRAELEADDRAFEMAIAERERQLQLMKEDYETLKVELQSLLTTKSTLDTEISIYAKLLGTQVSVVKVERDSRVKIIETDVEGTEIVLKNSNSVVEDISGYILKRIVDGSLHTTYTFPAGTTIGAGQLLTLYAGEARLGLHSGNSLVLVNHSIHNWGIGNRVETTIHDSHGKFVFSLTTNKPGTNL